MTGPGLADTIKVMDRNKLKFVIGIRALLRKAALLTPISFLTHAALLTHAAFVTKAAILVEPVVVSQYKLLVTSVFSR